MGFANRRTGPSLLDMSTAPATEPSTAGKLKLEAPHANAVRSRLLALQNQEGGWITDYDAALKPVGLANVETTCLALLALRAQK